MIPPFETVTTKFKTIKHAILVRLALFSVLVAVGFSGCTPHGPRELLQGKKLIEQGKYLLAIEKLRRATEIMGTNAHAWNYFGLACHYAAQPVEAEKAYQRALLLDHDLSEAHYNLGCLYLEQSKPAVARNELTAYSLRRGSSLDASLMLGLAELRCREGAAAEKSYLEVARLNPQSPEALNGLGLARLQRGRAGDALTSFKAALAQQPDYGPALLNAAIVLQTNLRDPRGALEKYRQYLALKPAPADAAAIQSQAQQLDLELNPPPPPRPVVSAPPPVTNNGAVARAPLTNTLVANLTPTSRTANSGTSSAPAEIASKPTNTSVRSPAAALTTVQPGHYPYKNPGKPAAGDHVAAKKLFAEGWQAQQAHHVGEAVTYYRAAIQSDPAYFEPYYNLGSTATDAGDLTTALGAYETALVIRPESLDARYNFALLLKQANYLADAANEFEKLVARYPSDGRAHLALGNIYAYADQFRDSSKARQHYAKVLETDPHNSQASLIRSWLTEHPL
jgi:tetratricopeptide (TPR) repeat protein